MPESEPERSAPITAAPTTVIYVAGDGRSGSTLLEGLLAAATGAVAVGEARMWLAAGFRWGARCGCGEQFTSCRFWSAVVQAALPESDEAHRAGLEAAGRSLIANRHVRLLDRGREAWSAPQRALGDTHVDLYQSVLAVSGAPLIVDSSKTPAYALFLAAQPEVDLRVIHLVRDSRAVVHSWTRDKEWKAAAASGESRRMRRLGTAAAARQWMIQNALCEVLTRRVEHSTRIRYEDLAADPARVVSEALERIDIRASTDAGPGMTEHGFLGNPMRFDESPREIVLDDAWRRELPGGSRRAATLLTSPLLLRHGYSLRS